jgi:riboflavin transporter
MKTRMNVNLIVKLGMLSALSLVLMLAVRFPLIPSAPFLEYEPGDVPALIGCFLYGPVYGLIITFVVSAVQAFTVSAGSGWVGAMMHIIATGTFVMTAGLIYRRLHTLKGAIIALAAGSISMTLIMIPLNLIITPLFLNVPLEVVKGMILTAIVPFNLAKAIINSLLTLAVYKAVGKLFRIEAHKSKYAVRIDESRDK